MKDEKKLPDVVDAIPTVTSEIGPDREEKKPDREEKKALRKAGEHNEYSNPKQIHNKGKTHWLDEVTEYSEEAYVAMDILIPLKPATINLPHVRSDLASTIYYSDAGNLLVETLQEARATCEIKRRTQKSQPAAAATTMSAMLRRLYIFS